jgi:hypothetical protein
MKTPKRAVVTKKLTDEIVANSNRWTQFIIHSGIRFEDLSNEWVAFFDGQSEISTAQTELVRLIDIAMNADKVKENK